MLFKKYFFGFFAVFFFISFSSNVVFAAKIQIVMSKKKRDFVSPNVMIRRCNECISVFVHCVDCKIFDKVFESLERDGWRVNGNYNCYNVGNIWVGKNRRVDIALYGCHDPVSSDSEALVEELNRAVFRLGVVDVISSSQGTSVSLFKKITDFRKPGEYFVPEEVDGYEYLNLNIYADYIENNEDEAKKNSEIQKALKNPER